MLNRVLLRITYPRDTHPHHPASCGGTPPHQRRGEVFSPPFQGGVDAKRTGWLRHAICSSWQVTQLVSYNSRVDDFGEEFIILHEPERG